MRSRTRRAMTTSDALDWAIPVVVGLGALLLLAVILLAVALSRLAKLSGQNHPQLWHIDEDELHIDCNEQGQPVVLSHHSAGEVYGGTYRGAPPPNSRVSHCPGVPNRAGTAAGGCTPGIHQQPRL